MKILINVLIILMLSSCHENKPKIKTGLEGKAMPAIDLLLADNNAHLNTGNIKTGKPTILFAFEPWCPYCKAQTRSIISHIESLKEIDIYFVTNSAYPQFKVFYDKFELAKYPNIKAGIDYTYEFANYFKTSSVPYMAIYDKDKKLKQVLKGKNYISTIKDIALN